MKEMETEETDKPINSATEEQIKERETD